MRRVGMGTRLSGTRWRDELGAERLDLGLRLLARRVLVDLARERGVLLLLLPHLALLLKLPPPGPRCQWCTLVHRAVHCVLHAPMHAWIEGAMQGTTLRAANDAVHGAMHCAPAPPASRCQSVCCPCRPRSPARACGAHAACTHAVHMPPSISRGVRFPGLTRSAGECGTRDAGVGAPEHGTARCGEGSIVGQGPGKSTRVGRLADLPHLVVICDLARVGLDQ